MAQELVVNTWCDICLAADGTREEGHPTPNIGGRMLDVCKRHDEELVRPLVEAIEAHGRRIDAPPKRSGDAQRQASHRAATREPAIHADASPQDYAPQCPRCGHQTATSAAMSAHLKAHHGLSMADAYGLACPVCGVEFGSSGIGMHLVKGHGLTGGMTVAYEWARANGDPAGVVAARAS